MSTEVDNRIVRMQFDNSKFEKNVHTTLTTIDKLKKSLKLEDAAKGFDEIDKAANGIDFSGLNNGITEVHNNFKFLDTFVTNIYKRISDAAIDTGKKIVNALAIDPITTGFQEYETKMNSIQVIAANTGALNESAAESAGQITEQLQAAMDIWTKGTYGNGQARIDALTAMGLDASEVQAYVNKLASGVATSMDDLQGEVEESGGTTVKHIEEVLDNLNLYADKTIYNFTQMTQAIGQFTTAGVDVDTSATAVKGIANLAAYVGAPASDASRAMFQLSQALSTGRVRLQDWMSLEHTAGMGGKVFQDALIKTAEKHGVAVREMIEANGSFRESLKEDWLTTDVLNETLAQFSGDFDKKYWEALGYTEQEIADILELGEVATDAATKVRTFTQMWDALKEAAQSGWTETWQYIVGGFEDAPKLWTAINDAVTGIIDPFNSARNEALKFWYSAKINGRSSWFDVITQTNYVLDENGKKIAKVDEEGKELTDQYGRVIYETEQVTKKTGILVDVWDGLWEIINPIKEAFQEVFPINLKKTLLDITKAVSKFAKRFKESNKHVVTIKNTFKLLFSVVKVGLTIFTSIIKVVGALIDLFATITDGILDATDAMGEMNEDGDILTTVLEKIETVTTAVTDVIKNMTDKFKKAEGPFKIIAALFEGVVGAFKIGFAIFEAVVKIIGAVITKLSSGTGIIGKIFTKVSDFITNSINVDKIVEWIGRFSDKIVDFVNNFDTYFRNAVDVVNAWVKETTGVDLYAIWDWILEKVDAILSTLQTMDGIRFSDLKELFTDLKNTEGTISAFSTVATIFSNVSESILGIPDKITELRVNFREWGFDLEEFKSFGVGDAISGMFEGVDNFVQGFDTEKLVGVTASIGLVITAMEGLKIVSEIGKVTQKFGNILEAIQETISAVGDTFATFQDYIKSNMILNIAIAIGILALALVALAYVPQEQLAGAIAAIIAMFWGLNTVLATLGTTLTAVSGPTGALGLAMAGIGLAILMMVTALTILAYMDTEKLTQGLMVLYVVTEMIPNLIRGFFGVPTESVLAASISMVILATAVSMLAGVLWLLTSTGYSLEDYAPALGVILALTAIMTLAAIAIGKMNISQVANVSATVLSIAGAIDIMAGAILLLTSLASADSAAFDKAVGALIGILAVTGVIAAVLAFVSKIGGRGSLSGVGTVMLSIAAAVLIISFAVQTLGSIENMDSAMSALNTIMGWLMGFLAIIGVILTINKIFPGGITSVTIALSLLITTLVGAFAGIVGLIAILGAMEPGNIEKALKAFEKITQLVTPILIIVGVMMILGAVIGAWPGVAPALMSVALAFLAFAGAIALLALGIWLAVDAIKTFWNLLEVFGDHGAETLKKVANQLTEALPFLTAILITLIPDLMRTIFQGIVNGLDVANEFFPEIAMKALMLLNNFIVSTLSIVPDIVAILMTFLIEIILQLAAGLQNLCDAIVVFIIELINGVGLALQNHADELTVALFNLLIGIWDILMSIITGLWEGWKESDTYKKLEKFRESVYDWLTGIKDNIVKGVNTIWNGYKNSTFYKKMEKFGEHVYDFLSEIGDNFKTGIEEIGNTIATAWDNSLAGKLFQFGSDMFQEFMNGIQAHSPSELFAEGASYIPAGVAKGIDEYSYVASNSVEGMADDIVDTYKENDPLAAIMDIMESDEIISPTITPVLDTDPVEKSASNMSQFLSSMQPKVPANATMLGDMSQYTSGIIPIDTSLDMGTGAYQDVTSLMGLKETKEIFDNERITAGFDKMSEMFDKYAQNSANQQIVLDTGTLVGATVGPMDKALGQRSVRSRRGG